MGLSIIHTSNDWGSVAVNETGSKYRETQGQLSFMDSFFTLILGLFFPLPSPNSSLERVYRLISVGLNLGTERCLPCVLAEDQNLNMWVGLQLEARDSLSLQVARTGHGL